MPAELAGDSFDGFVVETAADEKLGIYQLGTLGYRVDLLGVYRKSARSTDCRGRHSSRFLKTDANQSVPFGVLHRSLYTRLRSALFDRRFADVVRSARCHQITVDLRYGSAGEPSRSTCLGIRRYVLLRNQTPSFEV